MIYSENILESRLQKSLDFTNKRQTKDLKKEDVFDKIHDYQWCVLFVDMETTIKKWCTFVFL